MHGCISIRTSKTMLKMKQYFSKLVPVELVSQRRSSCTTADYK